MGLCVVFLLFLIEEHKRGLCIVKIMNKTYKKINKHNRCSNLMKNNLNTLLWDKNEQINRVMNIITRKCEPITLQDQ